MTENESVLMTLQNALECATDEVTIEDLEYAINAVNEIQAYRAIGTVEEFKALQHFESNFEHNLNAECNKAIDDFMERIMKEQKKVNTRGYLVQGFLLFGKA